MRDNWQMLSVFVMGSSASQSCRSLCRRSLHFPAVPRMQRGDSRADIHRGNSGAGTGARRQNADSERGRRQSPSPSSRERQRSYNSRFRNELSAMRGIGEGQAPDRPTVRGRADQKTRTLTTPSLEPSLAITELVVGQTSFQTTQQVNKWSTLYATWRLQQRPLAT